MPQRRREDVGKHSRKSTSTYNSRTQSRTTSQQRYGAHSRQPQHARRQPQPQQQTRRSSQRQPQPPKRNYLPIIIGIIIGIIAVCLIRFVACSGPSAPQQSSSAASSASTSTSASVSASTAASTSSSASKASSASANAQLTANEQDRLRQSDSANDVKPTERVVYLTFDDGPSSHTHQILDTLDQYGIKATWFVMGNTGHLDYVKDIWDRGNQVALHTYEHDYNYVYASPDNFVSDISRIGSAVNEYLGFTPTLIRFPGGSNNGYNAGNADAYKQAATNQGWHFFDWNVSIGDSTVPPSDVDTLVGNIISESEGCNSCCVLMHDSDPKGTTADALPRIIEYYQSQGYTFDVLVSDSYGYHF